MPQLEIERDFSTSVEMTKCQTRAQSLSYRPKAYPETCTSRRFFGTAVDALLTSKCVKFIGSGSRMGCQPAICGSLPQKFNFFALGGCVQFCALRKTAFGRAAECDRLTAHSTTVQGRLCAPRKPDAEGEEAVKRQFSLIDL